MLFLVDDNRDSWVVSEPYVIPGLEGTRYGSVMTTTLS